MSRTRTIVALAALTVVVIAGVGAPPAGAAPRQRATSVAYLRGAHLSPDTPSVDVYLTAFAGGHTALWLSNVGYGDVSGYRRVPAGTYAVSMRPHGASARTKPVLSWTVRLSSGHAYTAAAIGENAKLHGVIFGDSVTAPGGRHALVRVVQASDRAKAVDVAIAGGPTIAHDAAFGTTTGYTSVPAGRSEVTTRSTGSGASVGHTRLTLPAHSVVSLAVLDAKGGGVTVRSFTDAAGAAAVPQGSIDTGAGGTASGLDLVVPLGGVAGLAAAMYLATHVARPTVYAVSRVAAGPRRPAAPVSVAIPSLGIRSSLQRLRLVAGHQLQPPSQWGRAGWYAGGVVPGRPGPAVIAGHVDSYLGPAVFYRLRDIRVGARVLVRMRDGRRLTFVVDGTRQYSKTRLPSAAVYGATPDPQLRLVTCTGRFDPSALSYVDDLVVSAHLLEAAGR